MSTPYPLAQLLDIKVRRFDEAVKVLAKKREILAKEEEKLRKLEKEKEKVVQHKMDKLTKLREALDEGIKTPTIQQMKQYLKTVEEKLAEKKKQVAAQKKEVDTAQKQVDTAQSDLYQKQKDVEKLKIHKKEWEKEMLLEEERKLELEQDEIGSSVYELKKRSKKHR